MNFIHEAQAEVLPEKFKSDKFNKVIRTRSEFRQARFQWLN